ncbi:DNA cytosine methyltransferase [Streptacidiphilus jiangxiensis]|nr:DNA cytosine methyltransferase [Streptacidiphilus jiangxiensis]
MHSRPDTPGYITVLDLFAGCGGFTQGFHEFRPVGEEQSGPRFRSLAAVEHDTAAAATYAANFGEKRRDKQVSAAKVHVVDIEDWTPGPELAGVDVVVGGPPCQGFSGLNRGKVGAERNRLWEEYVEVVEAVKPKVFVIENVDRFVRSPEFADLRARMAGNGPISEYTLIDPPGARQSDTQDQRHRRYVLNSADYGAVQARRRAIVIGVRTELLVAGREFAYPTPTHSRRGEFTTGEIDGTSLAWEAVDSVFDETRGWDPTETELPDLKDSVPEVVHLLEKIAGIFRTTDLHIRRNPEELSLARYKAIDRGGNRTDLRNKAYWVDAGQIKILEGVGPEGLPPGVTYLSTTSWDNHRSGSGDVMGRLRRGHPSVTIRTEFFKPEKGRYLHPELDRPITHYEAARIQGFPKDFRWCGSKQEIARQIGNAVPIPLGKAVAGAIHEFLHG